jgi:hypothetical protein
LLPVAFLAVIPEGDLLLLLLFSRSEPKSGPAKNKVQNSGVFSAVNFNAFSNHVKAHFHHVLTIKNHTSVHRFFQNPP